MSPETIAILQLAIALEPAAQTIIENIIKSCSAPTVAAQMALLIQLQSELKPMELKS